MESQYNPRNPAVKRLMREAAELHERTELYHAQPLEDNLFEWHFTVRGPPDTDFHGGIYHGRILLPPEYPMKPPSIMLLTPNGRFETNKKICLSISGYHPESWQPSWSIRTALLAIIGFMPTHGGGAIGSLDYTKPERQTLAKRSQDWQCAECGIRMTEALAELTVSASQQISEANELAKQVAFQDDDARKAQLKQKDESATTTVTATTTTTTTTSGDLTTTTNTAETTTTTTEGVRQRNVNSTESNGTSTPASTTTTPTSTTATPPRRDVVFMDAGHHRAGDDTGSTTHLVLIVLVSIMLAALLARRLLIANEYRLGLDESSQ